MSKNDKLEQTLLHAPLKIVALESSQALGRKVNDFIVSFRKDTIHEVKESPLYKNYNKNNYLVSAACPRFGTGEGWGHLKESVRGTDLFIMVDVCNYSLTYTAYGHTNFMSPDNHYQDLKRIISAATGKAARITVIMPYLYGGRQHKRIKRESLDSAVALRELVDMGVNGVITFDAHDPRIQNSIPLNRFDSFNPAYQFLKALFNSVPDIKADKEHLVVVSPDEGAMERAIYFSNVLSVDMGMFYKRRDYSTIVGGKNPIVAHEFLGIDISGKDIIIVDDMISSGESMLESARMLKERDVSRVFICTTFGLFTNGFADFDKYYEQGYFDKLVVTNLTYLPPAANEKPYLIVSDMSKYLAFIIDSLNREIPTDVALNPTDRIKALVKKYKDLQG